MQSGPITISSFLSAPMHNDGIYSTQQLSSVQLFTADVIAIIYRSLLGVPMWILHGLPNKLSLQSSKPWRYVISYMDICNPFCKQTSFQNFEYKHTSPLWCSLIKTLHIATGGILRLHIQYWREKKLVEHVFVNAFFQVLLVFLPLSILVTVPFFWLLLLDDFALYFCYLFALLVF